FGQVEKLVDSAALTIGSSSAIFACGAARLGLKVAFVGICGEDVFGRFMLAEMSKCGVDVSHVIVRPDGQTGLSVILNQGSDRAILTHAGLIAELQASDIADSLLAQARHLHVASYFLQTNLQPDLPALFKRAHALGLSTSLDTNYDPSERWAGFDELLAVTNVFLPNEAEAKSLTGAGNVEEAATRLGSKVEALAIKLGKDGALGMSKSQRVQVKSIPVNVMDTVGAGDSFDAGFIYGYLNGWELEKSLRLACVCGALSTQQAGGTNGQPTLEEALKYL
ncbi:MAG TPA: sugar kinase, partial [Anaerolineales bacterium]|nr:sugar kinase [Anaerolineales bacterium]